MDQMVFESIRYSATCQGCGAESDWWGVQALVGGSLRWDTECACSACGFALASCGDDLPSELRAKLLSDHGPARLRVDPSARNAAVMRVLRAELGLDLAEVRSVLREVVTGGYSGTLPEIEFLARRLRASGIEARATRP